ncbi:conserved hypothetical protein [Ricinus communis]|uniref:KIB1-4 beta-propeller domain-containing protein n=1 Tax=Ricinus communis TaxID=3988 RepID=B9R8G5_RICCO|nr:conserved hypothetical protein [Ricinus communis]|eukprot:XP_025013426.1 F-box protein SKIP23-like [Ricinus communis]
MSNWSELPQELLQTITQKQSNYVDYISTRAVCKSWWSAIPKKPHDLLCQLPWLLLPYHKNNPNHRGFYNLADGKTYHLELPETIEKRCCGSSHGWLVMVEDTPSIFLLNPLTKARIELPSLSTFPYFPTEVVYENSRNINEYFNTKAKLRIRETYIRKAIVSEDPSTGNFAVMAIYKTINSTENIAFCKSGDATWFTIQETSQKIHYQDVMFHRGKFYAVDDKGRVSICITDINPPSVIQVADPPPVPPLMGYKQWYLASLDEDLILAGRFRKYRGSGYEYQTHKFMVYKLDASSSNWLELDGLGDMLSFLGWNCFHSISTQNYRNYSGNCIYFTDDKFIVGSDFPWEGHDYGIFNLDDKSVQRLGLPSYPIKLPILPFIYGYERSLKRDRSSFILPPPIWVTINP